MNWTQVATGLSSILGLTLTFRLVNVRLHRVYRIFAVFLLFEVFSNWLAAIIRMLQSFGLPIDYRELWLATRIIFWTLDLWTVYALLSAILVNLPGIWNLSRRVLNTVFPLSILVTLLTAYSELSNSGRHAQGGLMGQATSVAFVLERVIATVCLIVLLAMLVFILYFPVKMPKNLALFSIGFVFYFVLKVFFMFSLALFPKTEPVIVSTAVTFVLCGCFTYWIATITELGEKVPLTIGHNWSLKNQPKLIGDLEAINRSLLQASRRST